MDALKPHLIAHKLGYPMTLANMDQFFLIVLMPLFAEREKLHHRLEVLRNNKIPTLVVYGERDKLILKSNFKRLLEDLGANEKHLNYYSTDGTIENNFTEEEWIKVMIFRSGGHFAFAKYCDIVNNHINNLLVHK